MRAFIISRPKTFTNDRVTPEKLRESKKNLQHYIDNGIVEHSYAIVGGGSAFIVNVDSKEQLDKGIKENGLMKYSDVEIIEIEEKLH